MEIVPLSPLKPATVNDSVYKPVDPEDPSVIDLGESIRRLGQKDPILVTLDDVIISGHRRRVGCQLAGLTEVKIIREAIRSTDHDFLEHLVACNKQRVKSIDEIAREEIALADPDEPVRELAEFRRKAAQVTIETIHLRDRKKRATITAAKAPFLAAIKRVVADLRDFWPLSDRQVHYNLLNNPPLKQASKPDSAYRNDAESYKSLTELLTRARIAGEVPFEAIGDETRPMEFWAVHSEPTAFIRQEIRGFLKGYWRNLLQSQPNFLVLVGEKLTVESILRPVAEDYTIPLTTGRGYTSLPPRHKIATMFRKSGNENLVLIVASDHDPEGNDIPHALATSMRDDFGIENVQVLKAALKNEQVDELNIPPLATAKADSSRRAGFVSEFGENVYELEALPPLTLQRFVREAIESVLDMDLYRKEVEAQKRDVQKLHEISKIAQIAISSKIGA